MRLARCVERGPVRRLRVPGVRLLAGGRRHARAGRLLVPRRVASRRVRRRQPEAAARRFLHGHRLDSSRRTAALQRRREIRRRLRGALSRGRPSGGLCLFIRHRGLFVLMEYMCHCRYRSV